VVVLSTGTELVEPGAALEPGQLYDSNSLALTTACIEAGAIAYRVGIVPDEGKKLLDTLEDQLVRADLLVTSGGVSVGAHDVVKEVLSRLGTVGFHKVAMQPGMPQGFGVLGDRQVPVFTLPGNPVSALVSFEVFVAPALRLMAGRPQHETPTICAVAAHDWAVPEGKVQFARVVLSREGSTEGHEGDGAPGFTAAIAGLQSSHALGALAGANALAVIPAEVTAVRAGDHVACYPLGPVLDVT
jgi:molybdopterin molybdotransferase